MAGRKPRKPREGDTKVGQIVKYLREMIESEEWPHDHEIPSQNELKDQFGVSLQTARNAIGRVTEEGMLYTTRGLRSRVNWPNPPHRLFIDTRPVTLEEPRTPFVELTIGAGAGPVKREWTESDVQVPKRVAWWLELEAGATMLRRRQIVFVGRVPILMSTSFLQVGLTGGEGWRDVEAAQLALTEHMVTTTFVNDWSRMPRGEEFEQLHMRRGEPVKLVCRPYQVFPSAEAGSPVQAGVMVVARSDYVYTRYPDPDGPG
jgi:DNA-binding GntR family transcriptional regulator